jgi:DnaJ-domain-containing protein 1
MGISWGSPGSRRGDRSIVAEKLPGARPPSKDGQVRSTADADAPDVCRTLGRGELVPLTYRLGRQAASGVLTLSARAVRPEVFVLRRGAAVCGEGELARRGLIGRLTRMAAEPSLTAAFGQVTAYPPGALHQVALAGWARSHLEAQLDASLAQAAVRELGELRVRVRPELAPEPVDDADRRMLAALAQPRRLDQIWSVARTPRFRLLALLHFLRAVDALEIEHPAARPAPATPAARAARLRGIDPRRAAALRLLGVDDAADAGEVKRAYRRLARTLHPDLQPGADEARRRTLERRFAELTSAYESLV